MDGHTPASGNRNYALLIAIDQYQTAHYPHLQGGSKIMLKSLEYLQEHFAFEPEDCLSLINEAATKEKFDEVFMVLQESMTEWDNLFLIFQGVGLYREKMDEGYWLPYDGLVDKISTAISNTNLISIYLKQLACKNICLLVDGYLSPNITNIIQGYPQTASPTSWFILSTQTQSKSTPGNFLSSFLLAYWQKKSDHPFDIPLALELALQWYLGQEEEATPWTWASQQIPWQIERLNPEERMWKKIKNTSNTKHYRDYLRQYPAGRYASRAHQYILQELAEKAWLKTQESGTIEAYTEFILYYPTSHFVDQAKAAVENIRQEKSKISRSFRLEDSNPYRPQVTSQRTGSGTRTENQKNIRGQIKIRPVTVPRPQPHQPVAPSSNGKAYSSREFDNVLSQGKLICRIPRSMTLGHSHACEIRIADLSFPESQLWFDDNLAEEIERKNIKISKVMKVELKEFTDQKKLNIAPLTNSEQIIVSGAYTFWKYNITPQQLGNSHLVIHVNATINLGPLGIRTKDVLVWNKEILVSAGHAPGTDGPSGVFPIPEGLPLRLQELKRALGHNQILQVLNHLERLLEYIDLRLYRQVVGLKGQFTSIRNQAHQQTISDQDYLRLEARIRQALLELIDQIYPIQDSWVEVIGLNEEGDSLVLDQVMKDL